MLNNKLIIEFEKLAKQKRYTMDKTKDKEEKLKLSYGLQSINRVLKIIREFPTEIKSSTDLKNIKYVGAHTLKRIDEILNSGKLEEINEDVISDKYLDYINDLGRVYGIGDSLANKLYAEHGIKNVAQLKKLSDEGKIKLPDVVLTGLKYFGKSKENIPRDEMENIDIYLHDVITETDNDLFGVMCGSYRRNYKTNKTSNDIDLILVHKSDDNKYLHKFVEKLIEKKFIVASLTASDVKTKYMGLCKLKKNPIRRIDIRFVPMKSYYFASLYFTGPRDFNKKMRMTAINMNYKLNEYGLFDKNNKSFDAKSEKEIFDKLNMEYVDPTERA